MTRYMADKHKARLASFVIFERDGKILMARRANTGYSDGMYQMPSGHIEANEYPIEAAIREAKEETGVDIRLEDLELIHVSYRINTYDTVGDYVDFFFKTTQWEGEPIIAEPDKCDELLWVAPDALPENTVGVVKEAMEHIRAGRPFSSIGKSV